MRTGMERERHTLVSVCPKEHYGIGCTYIYTHGAVYGIDLNKQFYPCTFSSCSHNRTDAVCVYVSKRGAVSQVLFLAVGLCGLPVFAMGGGIGYVLKPSFGYLLAFPFAAWVSGRAHHSREAGTFIRANIYAALVIFVSGSVYLYTASNLFLHVPVTIFQAVLAGFLVFVPGEIVKIAAAGVLCAKLQDAARRIEL